VDARLARSKYLVGDTYTVVDMATEGDRSEDRHAFKTEMDDEAKRAMFPHNYRAQARA